MQRKILHTLVSAFLVVLVFEPFGWWPIALVAWIPLCSSLREVSARAAFFLGLIHGLVVFGATLSWMWNIFGWLSIGFWGILALFTAVASLLMARVPKKHFALDAALMAVVWTGVEYFRSEVFTLTFPWITAGTGLPPNWVTPIFGVYGVTFIVVLGSALMVERWKCGAPVLAVMGVAVFFFPEVKKSRNEVRVALIQDESANLKKLREVSLPILEEVDVVVWPEYSLGDVDEEDLKVAQEMAGENRLFVASGMEQRAGVEGNTAITVSKEGILGRHVKNHPVHFFSDGVTGTKAEVVKTAFGRVGTPICFDCDHQDVVRRMSGNGAEFFLIPSLDAKNWSSRQHKQHGMLFRHRAAENGRWLAVASSSGVTQIIDARGFVKKKLSLMTEEVLVGRIAPVTARTIFQVGGWLIGPIMMIGAGVVILWLAGLRFAKSI